MINTQKALITLQNLRVHVSFFEGTPFVWLCVYSRIANYIYTSIKVTT